MDEFKGETTDRRFNSERSEADNEKKKFKDKARMREIQKQSRLRKRRLIVRNLSFKATEEDLRKLFSKYGNVVDVTIPLMENKLKRGFAFVQYEHFNSIIKAMKELNYKELYGRAIAIDYAVDKSKYQQKLEENKIEEGSTGKPIKIEDDSKEDIKLLSESEIKKENSDSDDSQKSESEEDEDISDSEKRVQNFLKDFDARSALDEEYVNKGEESSDTDDEFEEHQVGRNVKDDDEDCENDDDEDSESDDGDDDEDNEDDDDEDNEDDDDEDNEDNNQRRTKTFSKQFTPGDRKPSNDVAEKKTVFLRNVSFLTTDEDLEEAMAEYGEFDYCLICMDKLTNHPKGTAFVKFKNKDDADKLIKKSNEEPGIFIDGRKVHCSYAISRETVQQQIESKAKQPKDKRNMHLLKAGFIGPNSNEAEGVSESDMKKRAQIEISMRQKLRHLKFFVSDKRLVIHNIPRNLTDTGLRKMFQQASSPKAVITEARVMKDFHRVDKKGLPPSRGYAFVCFNRHEDALSALQKLNNNPDIFSPEKRPIVEFSIENTMALQSKERRKEKSQMINKRKADDEGEQGKVVAENSSMSQKQFSKNRNKRRKLENNEKFNRSHENSVTDPAKELERTSQGSSLKQKKKKKKNRKLARNDQSLINHKNKFDSSTKKSDGTSQNSNMTSFEKKKKQKKKRKLTNNDQSLINRKKEFDSPTKKSDGTSESSNMTKSAKKRAQKKKRKLAYDAQSLINHKNEIDNPAKKSDGTSQSSNMTSLEKKKNRKKKRKLQSNDHSLSIKKNEFDSSTKKSNGTSQTSNMTSSKNKKNQKNKKNRKFDKTQNEASLPNTIGKYKTKLMNKMS